MKQLIVGNWKMNLNRGDIKELVKAIVLHENADVVVCPAFPYLDYAKHRIGTEEIKIGAQDCHEEASGAFTGDVSAQMLVDVGCSYVIVGHSERRQQHQESNYQVLQKAQAALAHSLVPIICIGESDEDNRAGKTEEVLAQQIADSIPRGSFELVVAYEPIWAIGTGRTPTTQDIKRVHKFIRAELAKKSPLSKSIPILYGGSVNDKNAASILSLENVNGVLVGGASLKAESFNQIIQAAVS